jgi:hypothetical protein
MLRSSTRLEACEVFTSGPVERFVRPDYDDASF